MKNLKKVLFASLVLVFTLVLVGCGSKKDYKEYIGYQFSGKDPWGNELAITVRSVEGEKLEWTYTDVIGFGEESITIYEESTSPFFDGETRVMQLSGKTDRDGYTYSYGVQLIFEDGKINVKYEDGSLTLSSPEGDSDSYQVKALEESQRTVTLTKVEDNA